MSAKSLDPAADKGIRELYRQLLEAWDKRNARDFALLFAPDGNIVGFDGTQVFGQAAVGAHLSEVFSHHQTSRYISIVREVRALSDGARSRSFRTHRRRLTASRKPQKSCSTSCGRRSKSMAARHSGSLGQRALQNSRSEASPSGC